METELENKGTYTEKQKVRLRRWRQNHKEKFNEVCRKASAVYYEKNKEERNRVNLERYHRKKVEKALLEQEIHVFDTPEYLGVLF